MVSYQQLQGKPNEAHSKASAMCNWEVFGIYASNHLTELAQRDSPVIILNINELPKVFFISN
jgi:hypothetical protein